MYVDFGTSFEEKTRSLNLWTIKCVLTKNITVTATYNMWHNIHPIRCHLFAEIRVPEASPAHYALNAAFRARKKYVQLKKQEDKAPYLCNSSIQEAECLLHGWWKRESAKGKVVVDILYRIGYSWFHYNLTWIAGLLLIQHRS